MKESPRWTHVVVGVAVLGALAVAAPAIGGRTETAAVSKKTVKKLVKKEVAKQLSNVIVRTSGSESVAAGNTSGSLNADCRGDERALGGGISFDPSGDSDEVVMSIPTTGDGAVATEGSNPRGWTAEIQRGSTLAPATARSLVVCTSP